ncbi:MAG: hypothetical protein HY420_03370 [Candidatus Kerfeldbacteria bacterium]|nr:hypothetical protein [Candidatus Kerfeldbacteria bacterium]
MSNFQSPPQFQIRMVFRISGWLITAVLTILTVVPPGMVRAATSTTNTKPAAKVDRAMLVNQSVRVVVLPPGRAVTVWFDFKNTGTATWTKNGSHPVGLNTDDPSRRRSKFATNTWRAFWRPNRIVEKNVKPGKVGRVRFAVRAPKKEGIFRERFALVRDQDTPIPGGQAEFVMVVGKTDDPGQVFQALPKERRLSFWVKPGERIFRSIEFRNVGYATWRNEGFGTVNLDRSTGNATAALSTGSAAALTLQATPLITKSAGRRESTTATLDAVAPNTAGVYTDAIALNGPFGVISGSTVPIEITVSEEPKPPLDSEPLIRVGVFAPAKKQNAVTKEYAAGVDVTANGDYEIRQADSNELLASRHDGQVTTVAYNYTQKTHLFSIDGTAVKVSAPIRLIPGSPDVIFEIKSSSLGTYNRFRGTLEIRYSSATGKTWIINELPTEQYLAGLGETGSSAPDEFVKTLVTAARTYALNKIFVGRKHASEYYHINSTTDQVYLGYNYELKAPNIAAAALATRGIIVTHTSMVTEKNKLGVIVAAYSSCTDGRTRSYYERWGGLPDDFPYLVSVPDPNGICTNTRWLQGLDGNHMVGLSATGALRTIVKDGLTFDAMLRYYYSGVTILRAYL